MAPIRPSSKSPSTHRLRALARIADPTLPRKVHRPDANVSSSFINSKRDRQQIRRSAFVSRISKSASHKNTARKTSSVTASSSTTTRSTKRRRPSKKLVTTLNELADALPEITEGQKSEQPHDGKIHLKSLSDRPGFRRRREKLVRQEVARFGANMAQLATLRHGESIIPTSTQEVDIAMDMRSDEVSRGQEEEPQPREDDEVAGLEMATTNRWAAIRSHISATLEQNPAFAEKS